MEARKSVTKEIKYPRFINNKPCGIDKFEGQSQKRLAKAIANFITSTDNEDSQYVSRIIGLEGNWGAGKSNVIKQIDKLLNDNYYLFEYDAWGHQEDLQRRSFIELLTQNLIKEAKILNGKEWEEKLNDLLAKRIERTNKSLPKFNIGALLTVLFIAITPITKYISERLEADNIITCPLYSFLIAFSPILIGLLLWGVSCLFNKDMRGFGYLLQISKDENIQTTNIETINEDEPTVYKFKAWMQSISDHIKTKRTKKLLIVFDNMDRLPAEKVKQLWSSIHTFFSEGEFENIWTIIPFDENHLTSAFGESGNNKELAKYFISKTFPIVYNVTPPVITDFKKIFDSFYEDAFGNTESTNQEEINLIFRLEKPTATIREIIMFINQLVSLKTIWENEIDILSMAIFTLKKDEIPENAVNIILSGTYLGNNIIRIIPDNELLQKNIAALIYGVSPDDAEQILILKYIENCLKLEERYNINDFSTHKHFISVLKDKINENELPIDELIIGFSKLNDEFELNNKEVMQNLWNSIAKRKMRVSLSKQEFDDIFKILLLHTGDHYKQEIIRFLCEGFKSFNDFNGEKYYNALFQLEEYIKENSLNVNLEVDELEVKSEIFIDYIEEAGLNYSRYKLKTNPEMLDRYIANNMYNITLNVEIWEKRNGNIASEFSHSDMIIILKSLKQDKVCDFKLLLEKIETSIKGDEINQHNFKMIFDTYKILINKKPFPVTLKANQIKNIYSILSPDTTTEKYIEISIMQIVNNVNISDTFSEDQIEEMAKNIEYYASYGNLLINCTNYNIPVLNKILNYLTINSIGTSRLSIKDTLPLFEIIKNQINVTESELLTRLNAWSEYAKEITKEEVQTIIPLPIFYKYSIETKNELTEHLNITAIEQLTTIPAQTLYQNKQISSDYWINSLTYLIDIINEESMPENIIEFGKMILKGIANSEIAPKSNEMFEKIIEKINRKRTSALIKDIRDDFCNGNYKINPQIFCYFEPWFEQQGDLLSRSKDVVHKILEQVIDNTDCLNIILSKIDYYAKIINNSGDDAIDLKNKIKTNLLPNDEDSRIVDFAKKIKISNE